MDSRIIQGDVLRFAHHYRGDKLHALLCDPPYELGFMGRNWDRSGIAFNPETWAALAEHLYPGAFGMAFASSRGWHRLAVAIEDAGLVIHPSIFGWAYGSGFPKATRVKDALDFSGHRYGLQALKPALEPIIVFQKPYSGKPFESIVASGAGALNIDGGRIQHEEPEKHTERAAGKFSGIAYAKDDYSLKMDGGALASPNPAGRWPANFYLQHLTTCNGVCAEGCSVAALGEQSGESVAGSHVRSGAHIGFLTSPTGRSGNASPHADTGTASRFFFNADWSLDVAEQLAAADPVRYVAKASRRERDAGLDMLEPGAIGNMMRSANNTGNVSPGFERFESHVARNPHPTVKPLALMRWLATLLLPPIAYAPRRILVPFAGSGSECIGAMLAGWDSVLGIEREREYVNIAKARLAYHMANTCQLELGLANG